MYTTYLGKGLCPAEGVRNYFCGGCRCANNTCTETQIDCKVLRYDECNTQVSGVRPVHCRVMVRENPATVNGFHSSSRVAVDDNVCSQTFHAACEGSLR